VGDEGENSKLEKGQNHSINRQATRGGEKTRGEKGEEGGTLLWLSKRYEKGGKEGW